MKQRPHQINLLGPWPDGIASQLQAVFGETVRVSDEDSVVRHGMIPWADLASLVSAVAAVIAVGLSLWDRKRSPPTQESKKESDVEMLNTHVKEQGIFGITIECIVGDLLASELSIKVRLLHKTSQQRFKLALEQAGDYLAIRIVSED